MRDYKDLAENIKDDFFDPEQLFTSDFKNEQLLSTILKQTTETSSRGTRSKVRISHANEELTLDQYNPITGQAMPKPERSGQVSKSFTLGPSEDPIIVRKQVQEYADTAIV
jgi:hypothetical protein